MLHCWFCGGRVVSLTSEEYRCEAEGVRWDMAENLVTYTRPSRPGPRRDAETGRYLSEVVG